MPQNAAFRSTSWFDDVYKPARQAGNLKQVLVALGFHITPQGFIEPNPLRDERTSSIHVYDDHWHDFGPGISGDAIDLLMKARGLTLAEAQREVARAYGIEEPVGQRPSQPDNHQVVAKQDGRKEPNWIAQLIDQAHQALKAGESPEARNAQAYLKSRLLDEVSNSLRFGVVDESIKLPQMGAELRRIHGRLIIPTYLKGKPVFYNARRIDGEEERKYLKPPKQETPAPFNGDVLEEAEHLGRLVLTEGELDAASLIAAYGTGYPVIGCSGGNLPRGWAERIAETRATVYVLFDGDSTGRNKAEKLQSILAGAGARTHVAHLKSHKDANEALQAVGKSGLQELVNRALEEAELATVSDYLYINDGWLAELDKRAERKHLHYSSGIDELDRLLNGGYGEGFHLLGGVTGGGKTSLALFIATHNALAGRNVIYASYEQSRLELWARIANRLTRVPYDAIKRGIYTRRGESITASSELKASEGWDHLLQVSKRLKIVEAGDVLSGQGSTWSIEVLASTAREIAESNSSPPLIIIDYLQRMPLPDGQKVRDIRERVGIAAGILQVTLARDLGAPVLALSSIGRASYNAAEFAKKAIEERLAAFKESGELEFTAYTAALLYALPEAKVGNYMDPGPLQSFTPRTLDLVKNREGETGRLAIKWKPRGGEWFGAVKYGKDDETL